MSTFIRSTQIDNKEYWYIFDDTLQKYLRKDWTWDTHCNSLEPTLEDPDNTSRIGFYDSKEQAEKHLQKKLKRHDKFQWNVLRGDKK